MTKDIATCHLLRSNYSERYKLLKRTVEILTYGLTHFSLFLGIVVIDTAVVQT